MLELLPIDFKSACEFINKHHRHHCAPVGHKFSIAAVKDDVIVGVVIVGRPVNRNLDNKFTLEVVRLASDGTKNVCSFLYSAAWRVTKNLGYTKLVTYILKSESGISLKASGWKIIGETKGRNWSNPSRIRNNKTNIEDKIRYEMF